MVQGLVAHVFVDYLWLRVSRLVGATLATVSISLGIPMAILCDLALQKPNVLSFQSVVGASAITVGFILVHLGSGAVATEELQSELVAEMQSEPAAEGIAPQTSA
ncbi:unnamed protein product [Symbiodinium necroappetens]|uniref:Uncharacterized protein n=1 Tax=Symbiodinium necroappetens TaxID=1628268 RepID=A0A812VH94_9DINO|nr:unnamed protein product [Symbiodinium necroappetens]